MLVKACDVSVTVWSVSRMKAALYYLGGCRLNIPRGLERRGTGGYVCVWGRGWYRVTVYQSKHQHVIQSSQIFSLNYPSLFPFCICGRHNRLTPASLAMSVTQKRWLYILIPTMTVLEPNPFFGPQTQLHVPRFLSHLGDCNLMIRQNGDWCIWCSQTHPPWVNKETSTKTHSSQLKRGPQVSLPEFLGFEIYYAWP